MGKEKLETWNMHYCDHSYMIYTLTLFLGISDFLFLLVFFLVIKKTRPKKVYIVLLVIFLSLFSHNFPAGMSN